MQFVDGKQPQAQSPFLALSKTFYLGKIFFYFLVRKQAFTQNFPISGRIMHRWKKLDSIKM